MTNNNMLTVTYNDRPTVEFMLGNLHFCKQVRYQKQKISTDVDVYNGQALTFQNTLTGKIHEDCETSAEDRILSPVEKCKTSCSLQCGFLVLGQQLVVAFGLVMLVCKVLHARANNVNIMTGFTHQMILAFHTGQMSHSTA